MTGIDWLGAFLPFYNKKAIDADIIHSHFVFPDLIIASSINIYNKPLVVTVRQGDFNNAKKSALNKYLFKKYLRKAAVIVALTPTIADKLKSYVIDSSKIKVIPNFIDSNFFEHPFLQSKSKEGKIGVICVANLIKRKNVDWLIRIHSNLPDLFNLTIVGSGTEYSMLKSIASASVIFTGKLARDDVISYLDANDLFILPSDKETFGLVFVEALSRGLPTIGKVGTGLDGFDSSALYFVNDEVELEELIKFHAAEHKEGVDHSESAMSFSTKFSEEQVVSLHLEVYESLI